MQVAERHIRILIDDLVEKGYVERVNDKKDRRRYIIVMTEAGDVLSDNFMTYLKGSLEQKMERIGMDKMSSLVGSMENIINITESISAK